VKAIDAEGLRQNVKIFVGGAPISQGWCDKIGADAYAMDALVAVEKAKACVTGLSNMKGGDSALHEAMLEIDQAREEVKASATAVG
jgi:hypothetical protein